MTSKERDRLFLRRASKSTSRGVWFLVATWRLRGRVQVTCRPGPSPVLLDRLSSEVACLSSGLGCLPCRIGKPLGGASLKERLLFCFLGSRGEGGGGNRKASTSRALERRHAAFTTMFWTPFRICCRSVETQEDVCSFTLFTFFTHFLPPHELDKRDRPGLQTATAYFRKTDNYSVFLMAQLTRTVNRFLSHISGLLMRQNKQSEDFSFRYGTLQCA